MFIYHTLIIVIFLNNISHCADHYLMLPVIEPKTINILKNKKL